MLAAPFVLLEDEAGVTGATAAAPGLGRKGPVSVPDC